MDNDDDGNAFLASVPPARLRLRTSIEDVLEELYGEKSPETVEAYRKDLRLFATWLGFVDSAHAAAHLFTLPRVEANAVFLKYKRELKEKKLAAPTINRRLASLKSLVRVGRRAGLIDWTFEVELARVSRKRLNRAGPTEEEVKRILATAREDLAANGTAKAVRDYAILRLWADLGLRMGGLRDLELRHIERSGPAVTIQARLKGQTDDEREPFVLPPVTAEALIAWLALRGDNPGAVFHTLAPGQLQRPGKSLRAKLAGSSFWRIARELGARVGVEVHPHAFRHSAITTVLNATGDVRAAQHLARHKHIRQTELYDDGTRKIGDAAARLLAERNDAGDEK